MGEFRVAQPIAHDSDRTDKIVSNKGLVKQLTRRSVIKNVHVWCPTIFILHVELLKMVYTNVVVKLYKRAESLKDSTEESP